MGPFVKLVVVAFLSGASVSLAQPCVADDSPAVDLGYEVHTGSLNSTGNQYLFSNIPYAEQPVGTRRFKPTILPTGTSSIVNNGSGIIKCMQSSPKWLSFAANVSDAEGQTEACLVLDVQVPVDVFKKGAAAKAPVLVHVHGGAFAFSSKNVVGNPSTLISRFGSGVVFVTFNYRLGLYGWLAGAPDAQANLGLFDQQLALQWVQKYIERFGGDPKQVTMFGESAGGSSILLHMTAYGGTGPAPSFSKAIVHSPAFGVNQNATYGYELTMATASNITGKPVCSVADLAALDEATLKKVNQQTVLESTPGRFVFGAVRDGSFVPALPQVLLASGKFHRLPVLIGHNGREGASFVSPGITSDKDVSDYLASLFPELKPTDFTYVLDKLYPAANYSTPKLRAEAMVADVSTGVCTTHYLASALRSEAYSFIFAYGLQYHGEEVFYVFFNGNTTGSEYGPGVDEPGAAVMQNQVAGFVANGDPNKSTAKSVAAFPVYGADENVLRMGPAGFSIIKDDADNERCAWWLQAMVKGLL